MAMPRLLTALLVALALPLSAAELSIIAGAAVQEPLLAMARAFEQQTGHVVKIRFDTVPSLARQIAANDPAAAADVFVGTEAAVDQAIKDGKADGGARMALGRIGVGIAVSRGSAKPDVSTVDALKAALLEADGVITSQGTSGTYVMKMLADIGMYEQVKGKTLQVGSGVAVMERLGTSKNEIGFTQMSEVMYGEAHGGGTLVAPLPAPIQNYSAYHAVVLTSAKLPEEARQFVRTLGSAAARKLLVANGWQVTNVRAQ
jgi:molybdate transport system substrate-binding protein